MTRHDGRDPSQPGTTDVERIALPDDEGRPTRTRSASDVHGPAVRWRRQLLAQGSPTDGRG